MTCIKFVLPTIELDTPDRPVLWANIVGGPKLVNVRSPRQFCLHPFLAGYHAIDILKLTQSRGKLLFNGKKTKKL